MTIAAIFILTIALLFGLAYATKRRFGVLGLALTTGSMLSGLWAMELTPLLRDLGLTLDTPSLITIVSVALVLLPAVLLLFSGPSYSDQPRRIGGALLFAALAFALLIEPLGSALVLQGQGKQVYDFFAENKVYIVTAGLIIALIDLLGVHTSHRHKQSNH